MKKLLLLLAVVMLGCQSNTPITEADREAIKKNITTLSEAIGNRSADMIKNTYTEDAITMAPNMEEILGVQKIIEFHTTAGPVKMDSFTLAATDVDGTGDLAYARGTWTFTGKMDTLQLSDNGKFLAVLKKQGNDWKILREIWNPNTPLPGN